MATLVGDIPSYRFVVGGQAEIAKNNLTMIFQDVVLEPAIIEVPQMHWGIFEQDSTVDTLQSRRSLRALLVPLTLLDIPQSANMYSFEAAKIYNQGINFSRENANLFNNETSIGDVRWISRKISNLTRADWTSIIQAAHYPPDVEALLIEKTIGRVDQFLGILGMKSFKAIAYNEYISIGKVVKGKETQEFYDGYVPRFTYGDPENPLRQVWARSFQKRILIFKQSLQRNTSPNTGKILRMNSWLTFKTIRANRSLRRFKFGVVLSAEET